MIITVFYGDYKNNYAKNGWKPDEPNAYNAATKSIRIKKEVKPSIESFKNGTIKYEGLEEVLKAFGEIEKDVFDLVDNRGSERAITLKNGMKIQVNRTNELDSNGQYAYTYIAMDKSKHYNADLFIRVDYEGKYIAWAWKKGYVDTIDCKDGIQRSHFKISGIKEI